MIVLNEKVKEQLEECIEWLIDKWDCEEREINYTCRNKNMTNEEYNTFVNNHIQYILDTVEIIRDIIERGNYDKT